MIGEHIDTGDNVTWNWAKGTAQGKVVEWSSASLSFVSDGETFFMDGTAENPVYLLEKENGERVLKQLSELNKV